MNSQPPTQTITLQPDGRMSPADAARFGASQQTAIKAAANVVMQSALQKAAEMERVS